MNDTSSQHFPRAALATAVATALLPGMAHGAAAGRVDFAYGDVKSVDTAGAEQRLRKGSRINPGDTIVTARGRAQIRFTDGARTSLLPNTEFKVETYEYEEAQPQEAKGFFSLLKGGLRTITGAIGRLRQDAYQVSTPVATIGIRGTEYLVVLGNSANLWVGAGAIVACNSGGCSRFENGESGYVPSATAKPVHTDQKPDDSTGDVDTNDYSAAEDVNEDGTPDVLQEAGVTGFQNGAFYAMAASVGDGVEGSSSSPVNATFANGVVPLTYTDFINGSIGSAQFEGASDGTVGWGRWFDGVIITDVQNFGGGNTESIELRNSASHHYAIGIRTPELPVGTASYSLIGSSGPTFEDGFGSPGTLNSGSLNVDFDEGITQVSLNLSIGGHNFDIDRAHAGIFGSRFSYNGSGVSSETGGCSEFCDAAIEGFFAGAGASRAGLAYMLEYDDCGECEETVNGSAAFANTGPGIPVVPEG